MEAADPSETFVKIHQTARRYIPEDSNLQNKWSVMVRHTKILLVVVVLQIGVYCSRKIKHEKLSFMIYLSI
jgi:hypothetical protein